MQAMLRLERGVADPVQTLRRYAPLADEIGATGVDVDIERADLLLSGARVAANEKQAMHVMAEPLLSRFGWRTEDFVYSPNVRYAETVEPPSGPPATRLVIDRADQYLGWEGATHGVALAPDRVLEIKPGESDMVARLFVTVAATTITGTVAALDPWLTLVEPTAAGVDRGRATLLYVTTAELRTEATRLGLAPITTARIEADADHVIETATTPDGTTLWLRRGADPLSPYWPGILEPREMVINEMDG
ncbi:hypothetical protein [Actinoplanes couchii]|uniref:Uncharacterized protein n=1 Tax=Actinoplanes couchii TaxID=403638 RepID=A0ABQ3XK36_9ACTN|nr:hypothetical protein [Actinoplanes couchii]GID58862.1 hypothetical protein Aco03nite_072660 [Actinoplanes couchii]